MIIALLKCSDRPIIILYGRYSRLLWDCVRGMKGSCLDVPAMRPSHLPDQQGELPHGFYLAVPWLLQGTAEAVEGRHLGQTQQQACNRDQSNKMNSNGSSFP